MTLEEIIYGSDISHDDGFYVAEDGDLDVASGKQCLQQWAVRTIVVNPGDDTIDTDWGAGVLEWEGVPATDVLNAMLASKTKRALIIDDRIGRVQVTELNLWPEEAGSKYLALRLNIITPLGMEPIQKSLWTQGTSSKGIYSPGGPH